MRTENRFERYDLNLRLPALLIPREDRFVVRGRIGAQGQELAPVEKAALGAIADRIASRPGRNRRGPNPAHAAASAAAVARRSRMPIRCWASAIR